MLDSKIYRIIEIAANLVLLSEDEIASAALDLLGAHR